MLEKKFKIMILRKLSEIQDNTDRQFNKIRRASHDLNGKFNKEIDIKKNKQNLELKNLTNKIKNMVESFNNRSSRRNNFGNSFERIQKDLK